ncbi:hypothetical protein K1T71_001780 [Dendrolimus kikuchii]|uniref:Uncharacterized protein n=1 Tax=Dendrolimus kikuchii TaxID=765133 RepID=A0ACC1DEW4_9NEOP|nr:hypothetical protein K1T71_001780 [Dendrolimus kikuchii]
MTASVVERTKPLPAYLTATQRFRDCMEEVSYTGINVTWPTSPEAINVKSDPTCYGHENIITRNCTNSTWQPPINNLKPCLKVVKHFDLSSCPPGYNKIAENINEYCYQIEELSQWNYPCFANGGATIISDLNKKEFDSLIRSLTLSNISSFFWLPAQRQKHFNPVVWYIPGPNWGRHVTVTKNFKLETYFLKDCALLDIKKRKIVTETCTKIYPSLCLYVNDLNNPSKCPEGYSALRFTSDTGTCYGIEHSHSGLTYDEFLKSYCKKPMSDYKYDSLSRFLFKKIAQLNNLPRNSWCWFNTSFASSMTSDASSYNNETVLVVTELSFSAYKGAVNNVGSLGLQNPLDLLKCMACETDVKYIEPEMMFEYNEVEHKIYITIYYPSYLWKYSEADKGVQCFSDDKGFVRVIDINDYPFINTSKVRKDDGSKGFIYVEKIVYSIDIVTDRSAQYWCEGHTTNFSLISTDKIIVNPNGYEVHVFSVVINHYLSYDIGENPLMTDLLSNLTKALNVKKILLMDIFEYSVDTMLMLLHVHVTVDKIYEDHGLNIRNTLIKLKENAKKELYRFNITLMSISSSVYCLPTKTMINSVILDWDLTPIGHISAPKQFCLQANGLPVKRRCHGSYHLGSRWGQVHGSCDSVYKPSDTTTFLYNFIKGKVSSNFTTRFLTDGLEFVLNDVMLIIPADIYYLSMSLQQILNMAQKNDTYIDMGDIDNIAWVMDRVMTLDCDYLRLAQSLNSTNIILSSVSDIIELIVRENTIFYPKNAENISYELAVKPQFVVQISYPRYNNITGIAISRTSENDTFDAMKIEPLYKNTTLDKVLAIENLEIATWIPNKLLKTLKIYSNESKDPKIETEDVHITISIFYNDAVFQEMFTNKHAVNSRILGLAIPGFISNLEYPVPILFRSFRKNQNESFCGYWDYKSKTKDYGTGSWRSNGCFIIRTINNITVCECYHLTHFGHLLKMPGNDLNNEPIEIHHVKALNTITLVGSFLSLVGIVGIWITALVFANWRRKAGTKVLLQLSSAIALPLILILVFNLKTSIFVEHMGKHTVADDKKTICIVLGALLHYSILSSFMWMLITAILQFIRYVQVLGVSRPSRFMVKFTVVGWGIPIIPITIVLAVNAENYIPNSTYNRTICYPQGLYMIMGVLVPICIILIINITLFLLVLHAISRGPKGHMKITDIDLVGAQLRLSVFLIFLLGLTWIFGIFSFSNNLLWSYLFCLTSTLQGFVLFIYFVICDPST